jgi:formiminotetrahydrofolate cyclodeaminase
MWEALASIVNSGNFVNGGAIILALALLGALVYTILLMTKMAKEHASNSKQMADACELRLEKITARSDAAIDRNTEAFGRFRDTLDRIEWGRRV